MKRRSPAAPLLLPFVTFGIYNLVWFVKTKNEINALAQNRIPTAWLIIVPIAGIWWMWKYAVGVEQATGSAFSRHAAFWLLLLLGFIGTAIVQTALNEAIDAPGPQASQVDPAKQAVSA